MKALRSKAEKLSLLPWCKGDVLFGFDFDGTLAPICQNPNEVAISKTVLNELKRLSLSASVVLITGRSLKDIRQRLRGFEKNFYFVGNHGAEGFSANPIFLKNARGKCRLWKKKLNQLLKDEKQFFSGVIVEDKTYSLSVHFRKSQTPLKVKKRIERWALSIKPIPRIVHGKYVVNLVSKELPNKGTAFLSVMRLLKKKYGIFVGDDCTDEDVFSLKNKNIMSVRVGKKVSSAAEYYLKDQKQILDLLKTINQLLRKT